MKQAIFTRSAGLSLLVILLAANHAVAQETANQKKVYTTSGGELILSWSNTRDNGADAHDVLRFSPFFNFQNQIHYDAQEKLGFFTGINIRNVGFIYDDPAVINTRYKLRTYTLGIPFAIKLGDPKGKCFFAGYELELPFNFKQKTFVNEDKTAKSSDWFSKRTPGLYHSLFAGVQGPYGVQLKFKYYLTNFVDQGYAANDGSGNTIYPYANLKANVFYISLSFQLVKDGHMYHPK